MFKRQDSTMNKSGTDEIQTQDITNSTSSTSSSSSDSFRHSQMALATDITQGLISEVRRLQALLVEKDQAIKEFEVSQADVNKEYILIQKHLKQKDEIEEKLKDENWNLEVTNQDLQERVTDLSQTVSKLNADYTKVLKQLRNTTEQMEISKAQDEKAKSKLEAIKAKYDHEQQVLRRNNGNLQREMEQMKKTINDLNTEIKIQRAKLTIKHTVENNTNHPQQQNIKNISSEVSENDHTSESINEISSEHEVINFTNSNPSSKSQHLALEVGTLKQSLNHAHRSIAALKSHLQKERVEKLEFKKMLADTQEEVEQLQKEIELRSNRPSASALSKKKKKSSKSTTSRKRIGLKKKSSKSSLTKAIKSENNIQQSDDAVINDIDQLDINNHVESDSNATSDEDDGTSSQNESMDDDNSSLEGSRNRLSFELGGNSLGIELQMGGFIGSSFNPLSNELNDSMAKSLSDELNSSMSKPLSNELNDSMAKSLSDELNSSMSKPLSTEINDSITKPEAVDVGINTENDWNLTKDNYQVSTLPVYQANGSISLDTEQIHHHHTETSEELHFNETSFAAEQPDNIIRNIQVIKNGNNIHATTSGKPVNDTPTHVSPETEISVDQQRGKTSVMGEYHTSAHSQAPFTAQQQNNDYTLDVNKKPIHDGTTVHIESSNDTVFINNHQDQIAELEISCSKTLSTHSGSEIKDDKSKEHLTLLNESPLPSSLSSSDPIKNTPVVNKALTAEYNNNLHKSTDHNVDDKQAYNDSQNEQSDTNKLLRDEIPKVTNEMEDAKIEIHDEIIMEKYSQIKENKQYIVVDNEDVKNTTVQIDREYAGQSNQQIKDKFNNDEPDQHTEITDVVINSLQDNIKNGEIKNDGVKQSSIECEDVEYDKIDQLTIKQNNEHGDKHDDAKHNDITHDDAKHNDIKHDNAKKDEDSKKDVKHIFVETNDHVKQDETNHDEIKYDYVNQSDVKKSVSKQEKDGQDQIEKNIINQETTQQEIIEQNIINTNEHADVFKAEKKPISPKEDHDHQFLHYEEKENTIDNLADGDLTNNEADISCDFNLISRDEANALIKLAIADALEKERLEAAARRRESEADFISKTDAENLAMLRVENALKKEREKLNKIMQKRQSHIMLKQLKEKENSSKVNESAEKVSDTSDQISNSNQASKIDSSPSIDKPTTMEQLSSMEQSSSINQSLPKDQVQIQLNKTKSSRLSQDNQSVLLNSNLAKRALSHRASIKNLAPKPQPLTSTSSINSQSSQSPPPPTRLGLFSGLSKLQPSFSTPSKGSKNVRPSVSNTSLRRATRPKNSMIVSSTTPTENDTTSPLKKTNSMDAAQHLSPSSAESFGNVRITERATYTYNRSLGSNQETISKQPSLQSILSMASGMHDKSHHPLLNSTDEKLQLNGELVHAITQTMIGEWMWKYTRRHVGNGISENKHKRFFWLHPFGRTIYWNTTEPGAESKEMKAKNAFIESVSSIPNNENSDGPPFSLLIKTSKRDLKITATTAERHEVWRLALSFLIVPESYEDTVGNVVNNSVSLSARKMTPSTATLLTSTTSTTSTTHDETDRIHDIKEPLNLEDAYDSDDSYSVHNKDHSEVSK